MSVDLSKLVVRERLELESLSGKVIAIDAYNAIYQFLSIIRQPDGTPLLDDNGNVTSHLSGLFYRTIEFVSKGIKPLFVFDGIPSLLKQKTINARMKRREEAKQEWARAMAEGRLEDARMHAQASTRINKSIVESSKQLLSLMGIPYMTAPSEGEAEASYLCRIGMAYAVVSQDYDTLLFGAPVVVRNLAISGKRKLPRKNIYINVEPEKISLNETLRSLNISLKQLVWIGIMLGTDFNEGIRGIGPKTALNIVKESKSIDDVIKRVTEKNGHVFDTDVHMVEDLFTKPEVEEPENDLLRSTAMPEKDSIIHFMCVEHSFSEERISKFVDKLIASRAEGSQAGISRWFK
ncbi:MAG: flap endonuclease-1 [Candidatus Micrarchaeaceae archaeon]